MVSKSDEVMRLWLSVKTNTGLRMTAQSLFCADVEGETAKGVNSASPAPCKYMKESCMGCFVYAFILTFMLSVCRDRNCVF